MSGEVSEHAHVQITKPPTREANGRWLPGIAPNPRGRPAAGASYTEWLNQLTDTIHKHGGRAELRRISRDESEPIARRQAADTLRRSMVAGWSRSGIPKAGNDLDRICDRTVGKPTQGIVVVHAETEPIDLLSELRAMLAGDATLLEAVKAQADRAALPILEGEIVEPTPGSPTGDS